MDAPHSLSIVLLIPQPDKLNKWVKSLGDPQNLWVVTVLPMARVLDLIKSAIGHPNHSLGWSRATPVQQFLLGIISLDQGKWLM